VTVRLTLVERKFSRGALAALRDEVVRRMRATAVLNDVQETTGGSFASGKADPGDIDVTVTVGAPLRDQAVYQAVVHEVTNSISAHLISGDELSVCCKETIWQLPLDLTVKGSDGQMVLNVLKPRREGDRSVIAREDVVTFFASYDRPGPSTSFEGQGR
jgi:hypothetical protein